MSTFDKLLGYNKQNNTWENVAVDNLGRLIISTSLVKRLGNKGNICNTKFEDGLTTQFDISEYGANAILTYEDNYKYESSYIDIFASTDTYRNSVHIGSIMPEWLSNKRYGNINLNLQPFKYIWVKNSFWNPISEFNAIISVFN